MKDKQEIEQVFIESGGVMTTKALIGRGVSHYFIKKMLDENFIESSKRGVYKLVGRDVDESIEVSSMVPKGVFCMFTAASMHELSTNIPFKYHVAIPKKDKIRLPDYPPVQLYYWDTKQYLRGVSMVKKNGQSIPVYDREKTVCDFLKFKNRVGFSDAKEVLKAYLSRKDRNIDKLIGYARELRVYSIVDQYLKILI